MNDVFEQSKEATRRQMLMSTQQQKNSFARKMKSGFGKYMVDELNSRKPPTKWAKFWYKIKTVLGL